MSYVTARKQNLTRLLPIFFMWIAILLCIQINNIPESLAQWPPFVGNSLYSGLYQPSFVHYYFPFGNFNDSFPSGNYNSSLLFSNYNSSFPFGSSNQWLLNTYQNSFMSAYLNLYRQSLPGYFLTPAALSWISGFSLLSQCPPLPLSSKFFSPPSSLIGSPINTLASVENEEYAVYSSLISSHETLNRTGIILGEVRIRNHTCKYNSGNDSTTLNYLVQNLEKIAQETILDYQAKNTQEYPLGYKFTLPFRYNLVGDREDQWTDYIIELSRVGFNSRRDQALVYVGEVYDYSIGGYGSYCFLMKVNGIWVYQDGAGAWIS